MWKSISDYILKRKTERNENGATEHLMDNVWRAIPIGGGSLGDCKKLKCNRQLTVMSSLLCTFL